LSSVKISVYSRYAPVLNPLAYVKAFGSSKILEDFFIWNSYWKNEEFFLCLTAGPEFGPLSGHLLNIVRALYGLRTFGTRWHDRFVDVMHLMGFSPCKAEPDVWKHDCITHYKYALVYVDEIMFIGKEPQQYFDSAINDHGLKLKCVGRPKYHLSGDFYRDFDGTLGWGAHSYVSKMLINYETTYRFKPKEFATPIIKMDHPEIDTSELLVRR
jgi:hypothetical protein